MKKNVIKKLVVLVACMAMVLGVPAVCMAAERGEPVDKVITSDGKTHTVYVFGTSLALESTDGSINVSPIGGLTGVDVMIDGVITKNVRALDAPAGQKTKLGLEEGSVYVKNVTPESGAAIKEQISEAYAAGATKVDIASLGDVVAYQVNESGKMENAAGTVVDNAALGGAVATMEQSYSNFAEQIKEGEAAEREARIAEEKAKEARAAINSSPTSSPEEPKATVPPMQSEGEGSEQKEPEGEGSEQEKPGEEGSEQEEPGEESHEGVEEQN